MLTDPISDMLSRIRNAVLVSKTEVVLPYSRVKFEVAKIFEREGYLGEAGRKDKPGRELRLVLKYQNGRSAIESVTRISKPGRRVYVGYDDMGRLLGNRGLVIISTSQGIMTGRDAQKRHLGGEVICEVY